MIAFFIALLLATPPPDAALLDVAIRSCTRNAEIVRQLFAIERAEGLPPGLIAAAALRESSCRPEIHCGDGGRSCGLLQLHGSHKRKAAKVYREIHGRDPKGDPRRDWRTSATYWARRVVRGYNKARAQCRGRGGYATRQDYLWASGNLTATWRPKCARFKCLERDGETCAKRLCVKRAARCAKRGRYETKHFATLRRFRSKAAAKHRHSTAQDAAGRLAAFRTAKGWRETSEPSRGDSGGVSGKGVR